MKYNQQKTDFLDSLQPDDFRNGGSFNQVESIIDNLNDQFYRNFLDKKNHEEFIEKAVKNLFRENSLVAQKAVDLAKAYLDMKLNA